jgi:pimeloyl-ACP methyl ester carboxylesterase
MAEHDSEITRIMTVHSRNGKAQNERRYVQVGSVTIYAEISGVGLPLILIHGLGGSTRLVLVDAAALPPDPLSLRHLWRMVWGLQHLPLMLLPVLCTDALRAGPRTLGLALRELLSADIRADLARIEAPTLIVWGEHDATLPVAVGRRLHEYLPQATFLVIRGASHCPMWGRPAVFNQAVMEFLAEGNSPTAV